MSAAQKTAILAQVGHFYFGAVGQSYLGANSSVCGKRFNSPSAFDRHRYGGYGNWGRDRRCRTWQELRARGWVVNDAGFWIERPRRDCAAGSNDQVKAVAGEGLA